ncbi:hypothetical protein HOLDEFILI_01211 [Holdemania filiformis DSM 12042]|uniref:Uncharacterized protein n=1 Tax=Holdemania filiformis DSM 12042 TaxID=545696 RepID=B9Y5X9_9FIRM|nr:hypothetical protein HOLDEFILI_01211 [Holdemania filiformis DSM 12042]
MAKIKLKQTRKKKKRSARGAPKGREERNIGLILELGKIFGIPFQAGCDGSIRLRTSAG